MTRRKYTPRPQVTRQQKLAYIQSMRKSLVVGRISEAECIEHLKAPPVSLASPEAQRRARRWLAIRETARVFERNSIVRKWGARALLERFDKAPPGPALQAARGRERELSRGADPAPAQEIYLDQALAAYEKAHPQE